MLQVNFDIINDIQNVDDIEDEKNFETSAMTRNLDLIDLVLAKRFIESLKKLFDRQW